MKVHLTTLNKYERYLIVSLFHNIKVQLKAILSFSVYVNTNLSRLVLSRLSMCLMFSLQKSEDALKTAGINVLEDCHGSSQSLPDVAFTDTPSLD